MLGTTGHCWELPATAENLRIILLSLIKHIKDFLLSLFILYIERLYQVDVEELEEIKPEDLLQVAETEEIGGMVMQDS